MKNINLIMGSLFGVAVGDALGAPLEFMSAESIRQQHGIVRDMIGGGWLNVSPGEVTDDTQMTIAVALGICENPYDPIAEIGRRFIEWRNSGPKDIGGTCARSITNAVALSEDRDMPPAWCWFGGSKQTHKDTLGRTGGNGALMRTAYVGLYYDSPRDASYKARRIARMTHFDDVATSDCAAYSAAICRMVSANAKQERMNILIEEICESSTTEGRYKFHELGLRDFKPNPTGYCVDSLKAALHCIFTTSNFENAVIKAVNLGGDADTIGAITGGLAGALYGHSSIPARWLNSLTSKTAETLKALCSLTTRS